MPLLNIDVGRMLRDRRDRRRDEEDERKKREELRRAGDALAAALSQRQAVGTDTDSLAGVTGANPESDLQAMLRNEELADAAANQGRDGDLARAMFDISALKVDPKPIVDAFDTVRRRQAIERVLPNLDDSAVANAANKLDASPFRFSAEGAGNRFTGDFQPSETAEARAIASRAAARSSNATAGVNEFKRRVLENVLSVPTDPLLAADIAHGNTVAKPQRVKVRHQDGSELLYDAIPNQAGGFDYRPAIAGGKSLRSKPDPKRDDRPALQKNAEYIAQQFEIPQAEATRILLFSKGKAPADAWADIVKSVQRSSPYADAKEVEEKARALWSLSRAGEPVPSQTHIPVAPGATPAPADAAPLPGARQAPDGNWYVNQGGQWFRVDQ